VWGGLDWGRVRKGGDIEFGRRSAEAPGTERERTVE
jgi:hypothetical protein